MAERPRGKFHLDDALTGFGGWVGRRVPQSPGTSDLGAATQQGRKGLEGDFQDQVTLFSPRGGWVREL